MLLIGIDWSQEKHAVCLMNEAGAAIARFSIEQSPQGLVELEQHLQKVGVPPAECLVGIETAHHLLVDFLWSRGYVVYVIPPSMVNRCRGRYKTSGACTDPSEALLIADLLRTDRARLTVWRPDGNLVRQMRAKLGLVDSLTKTITRYSNRLEAVLLRSYPQGLAAFGPQTQIRMYFLMRYPTAVALKALTYQEFGQFCRDHHYTHTAKLPEVYAALTQAALEPDPVVMLAYEGEVKFLAELLLRVIQHKEALLDELGDLYAAHPDHDLFDSLPGTGDLLGPKLLVLFGDHRERFPAPQNVRELAGTCPVTVQSGKKKVVHFRRACNHDDRHTLQQFALASVAQSEWAAEYYGACRARRLSKNQAYRSLANRWVGILWKLWQTHTLYDEAYHLQQIRRHRRPQR